ncbi:class I SAM-dependent methyltransferase [Ancylomarina sp. DW003]|nr:class I SAM-dependent methyltransferase [Ancylomarina sp. DW003]MDE5424263.1 class I SAM-dependent methyltransferase [Ancylomarina sp. DW003]
MDFYQSISKYYQYIFPLNKVQIDFILSAKEDTKQLRILDIGCAIGDLSMDLANHFNEVVGIDLDEGMIDKAIEKSKEKTNLHFHLEDMLQIDQSYGENHFDLVVCFGNTLVHLESEELVSDFFSKAHICLAKGGKLLFQIINYDRIIDQKINFLPTIENDTIRFKRDYTLHSNNKVVDFKTTLTIKETGESISNSIPLLAIRKANIEKLLKEAGFSNVKFYGNFKKDPFADGSIPLVVEARKA